MARSSGNWPSYWSILASPVSKTETQGEIGRSIVLCSWCRNPWGFSVQWDPGSFVAQAGYRNIAGKIKYRHLSWYNLSCFWKGKSFPLLFPSMYTYLPLWNLKRIQPQFGPGAGSGSGGKWIKHVRVFIERILSTEIFLHFNKYRYNGTKKYRSNSNVSL